MNLLVSHIFSMTTFLNNMTLTLTTLMKIDERLVQKLLKGTTKTSTQHVDTPPSQKPV